MGKQVRLFMTLADEVALLSSINSQFGPIIVVGQAESVDRPSIEPLKPVTAETALLWIVRTEDLERVVWKHVVGQGVYSVDAIQSSVIEFSRCVTMGSWLASGRIWFEERLEDSDKPLGFKEWANSIAIWVRRHFDRTTDGLYFVGPDAKRLCGNGLLNLGPPQEGFSPEQIRKLLNLE